MTRAGLLLIAVALPALSGCRLFVGNEEDATAPYVPSPTGPLVSPAWTASLELTHVSHGRDFHPHADRAGRYLVFASDRHAPNPDVYLKPFNSAAVTRLTSHPAADAFPKFNHSRSNPRVAFASNRDGHWNVYIADAAGAAALEQVTDDSHLGWDNIAPTFSPDDRWVAFSTRKGPGEAWTLRARNRDTGELIEFGPGLFPDWSVTWDLVYQRPRDKGEGWYSIYSLRFNSATRAVSNPTVLAEGADYACITPAWSSDGRHVAYATVYKSPEARLEGRMDRGDDIWVVDARGAESAHQVTFDPAADWNPAWWSHTENGQSVERLIFVSTRSNRQNLYSVIPFLTPAGDVREADPLYP